jgi:uncharacterized membrane protein YkvA (DUF1232 family)
MTQPAGSTRSSLPIGVRGVRFLRHLPHFARLYWRLLRDRRVSLWPKALLVLTFLYVVSPVDMIPEFVPLFGMMDDLVLVLLVTRLFIYLCPPAVVREHVRQIDAQT